MRLDAIAIPCRMCLAPPGRYCFVMTIHGAAEDSIFPDGHDQRRADAAAVARILAAGGAAEAPISATCGETWDESPKHGSCMHGYIWCCPRGLTHKEQATAAAMARIQREPG